MTLNHTDRRGLVHIYTGPGKGKTTAALGLCLRAVGRGLKVRFIQFMKPPDSSGEHLAAARLAPEMEILTFGRARWLLRHAPEKTDRDLAAEGLAAARRTLESQGSDRVDLLVLDEIFPALKAGLVTADELNRMLDDRPGAMELVLTGRHAPQEFIARADLVTEATLVRHPLREQGIGAREGIEY